MSSLMKVGSKRWKKRQTRKLRRKLGLKKPSRAGTRLHFYNQCVRYVKKQRGFILPQDTSYTKIVVFLERYAGESTEGTNYQRCLMAGSKLGITLPNLFAVKNNKIVRVTGSTQENRGNFYASLPWKKLRYETLRKHKAKCQCCGVGSDVSPIRVDHIKPVSKYWHLRLDPTNLQVLCNDCNWGKLNVDETDWRPAEKPVKARVRLKLVS